MSLLKRKKFLVLATVSGLLGTLIAGVEKTPETDTSNSIIQYNSKQAAKIDLVFVLDTTGSMSGLIRGAKEKIWSIRPGTGIPSKYFDRVVGSKAKKNIKKNKLLKKSQISTRIS